MLRRYRLAAVVTAAVAVILANVGPATAQDPALEVFYRKLDPREQFKYTWKGKATNTNAGVFRWEVPETSFGTNGLDRNFTGYCAEVLVPITADKTYRFRINSLYDPANFGLADHPNGPLAAARRGRYIQELFGRYFRDPVGNTVSTEEAVAFQIALWELIQEAEPAEGEAKRDLFAGDFRADYPRAEAPAFVRRAQEYLDTLTGDDSRFYENADLRGRELVRLMGIENAEKVVAQSQFALRYTGAGGAGAAGGGTTGGGGGGAVVGGVGAPAGGGVGGGLGGGGGLTTGLGGGGTTAFPTATPNTTSTAPPTGGSSLTPPPPTTTVTTPPAGGPQNPGDPGNPGNPVPAPAGVLLGAIALGTFGSWRLGARLLGRK